MTQLDQPVVPPTIIAVPITPANASGASRSWWHSRRALSTWLAYIALFAALLGLFALGVPSRFGALSSGAIGVSIERSGTGDYVLSPLPGQPRAEAGVREGDLLVAVDSMPVQGQSEATILRRLLTGAPGTQVRLDVQSSDGGTRQLSLTRQPLGLERYGVTATAYASYLTVLGVLLVFGSSIPALIIFLRKPEDRLAMFVALTIVVIAVFNSAAYGGRLYLPPLMVTVLAAAYNMCVLLVLYVFPDGRFIPRWTRWFALFGMAWVAWKVVPNSFGATAWMPRLWIVFDMIIYGTGIFAQIYRYRNVSGPQERQQTKWITFGIAVAFLAQYGYYLPLTIVPALHGRTVTFSYYQLLGRTVHHLALLVLPITVTQAILRRRLYQIDVIISRTLVYVPLSAFIAGAFAALSTLIQKLFVALTGETSDLAIVLTTLVVVATVTPIKDRLQKLVDRRFKETSHPAGRLRLFGEQVQKRMSAVDEEPVTRRLLEEAVIAFEAESGAAYLKKNGRARRVHTVGKGGQDEKANIPLQTGDETIGWISLGGRHGGRAYSDQDLDALRQAAQVVAHAIEQDRATSSS